MMRHIALGLCVAVLLGTLVVPAWGASVAASTASEVSGPTGSTEPQLPPSATGARLQLTVPGLPAQNPAVPAPDPTTGLLSLDGVWPVSYTVQTDPTWVSGVYLAKLSATNTTDVAYIHFVVRNDAAVADLL